MSRDVTKFDMIFDRMMGCLYRDIAVAFKLTFRDLQKKQAVIYFSAWAEKQGTIQQWKEMIKEEKIRYSPEVVRLGWKFKNYRELGEHLQSYYFHPRWMLCEQDERLITRKRPLCYEEFLSWNGLKDRTEWGGDLQPVKLRVEPSRVGRENDVIRLELTIWRGTSIGAIHYYAKLRLPCFSWVTKETKKGITTTSAGPDIQSDITLTYPLSRNDIRSDPERFEHYKVGSRYSGFFTEPDARDRGVFVVRKHFPGFRLEEGERYDINDEGNRKWLIQ